MRTYAIVVLAVAISACGDASSKTGLYAVQSSDQDALAAMIDCECFWDGYEYPSEAACTADRAIALSDAQKRCVERAGDPYPEFEDLGECQLIATTAKLACYQSHQDTCDPDGFDACDATEEAQDAACEPLDPCTGLTGSDAIDCESDRSQLTAAILDCF